MSSMHISHCLHLKLYILKYVLGNVFWVGFHLASLTFVDFYCGIIEMFILLTYAASAETKKQKRNRSFFISGKKKINNHLYGCQ